MSAIKAFFVGLANNFLALLLWFGRLFKSFTAIQGASLLLTIASGIMAYADTQAPISHLPGWLVSYWPMVLTAAGAVARYGHIFFPQARVYTAAQVQDILSKHIETLNIPAQVTAAVAQAVSTSPSVQSADQTQKPNP